MHSHAHFTFAPNRRQVLTASGAMALGGLLLGYAMVVLLALLLVAGLGIFLLFGRVALMEMLGQ